MEKYYYDVVASICNETSRTDSHLVCGGFKTKNEAVDYINKNEVSEVDYYKYCNDDETAYIEIEERDSKTEAVVDVITVD
jgi:hypothetical protein